MDTVDCTGNSGEKRNMMYSFSPAALVRYDANSIVLLFIRPVLMLDALPNLLSCSLTYSSAMSEA